MRCMRPSLSGFSLALLQDSVTPPGKLRQRLAFFAGLLALLILLPVIPESADTVSSAQQSLYL